MSNSQPFLPLDTAEVLIRVTLLMCENNLGILREITTKTAFDEYVADAIDGAAAYLELELPEMGDELGAVYERIAAWCESYCNLDDVCDECGGPNPDGGDGYDGKCADCADAAESDEDEE